MAIRKLATVSFILLLNLVVGLIYIHSWKMVEFTRSHINDYPLFHSPPQLTTSSSNTQIQRTSSKTLSSTASTILNRASRLTVKTPHPYDLTIDAPTLCTSNPKILKILVLVCSAVGNFQQRESIRWTWGSTSRLANNTGQIRLAFLLGSTRNETVQRIVRNESSIYSDIIQESFIDSYKNLTYKSVMLLKWVKDHCPKVQFVLKSDDDMYINIPNFFNAVRKLPDKSNIMFGVLFRKAKPNRNSSDKWYVPRTQFSGNVFPDYLSGTAYAMSGDVVPKLYEASLRTQFLVMEDVFITGVCALKCGIRRLDMKGFAHWKRASTGCAFRDVISGHHVNTNEMRKIWRELTLPLKCKALRKRFRRTK